MINLEKSDAIEWHNNKTKLGPTYSGTQAWQNYLIFLESKLKNLGVIDITKNKWKYNYWYTTEWPGDKKWSLMVEEEPIRVASYGAYSGKTPINGITSELIYVDKLIKDNEAKDKIIILKTQPHPDLPDQRYLNLYTMSDYEYASDPGTLPQIFTQIDPKLSVCGDAYFQLYESRKLYDIISKSEAKGAIIIYNMSYDRLAGQYFFPVPEPYNVPTLLLDRDEGEKVIKAARQGVKATLKLHSDKIETETYQLIGHLPGKNYGKPNDEEIILMSHTDGPSLTQENGALGILGVVTNLAKIPKEERHRTLKIFLDNRHYMPGGEERYQEQSWFNRFPEETKKICGYISMEHLGELEYVEDEVFRSSGRVEITGLWVSNDDALIRSAIDAVDKTRIPRTFIKCPDRVGIHGKSQGYWLGMGALLQRIAGKKIPGCSMLGHLGAHWSTRAGLDRFSSELFMKQVDFTTILTERLMQVM